MIEVSHLTKTYGNVTAVEDVSFTVPDGEVTAFLGNNGAGKSTTMRMILGLDHPNSGEARIDGKLYKEIENPIQTVGSLLDAHAINPKRNAYDHLKIISVASGLDGNNIDELLKLVGLYEDKKRPIGQFSLGMHQRLGIATALLGDPTHVILDEPTNGLDPDAIKWVRSVMSDMAKSGKSVLVSSHHLAEVAYIADNIVIIDEGHIKHKSTIQELHTQYDHNGCLVDSNYKQDLEAALKANNMKYTVMQDGKLSVNHKDSGHIGQIATQNNIPLTHLEHVSTSLEDIFFTITGKVSGI